MFVEVTRLLTVVLLTAAGFVLGAGVGPQGGGTPAGVGGILGCLCGYLVGGVLGRLLERAAGSVERRVDRVPLPQMFAGIVGAGLAAVLGLTLAVPVAAFVPIGVAVPLGALVVWTAMYLGFRALARRAEELFGLLGVSSRPLVRARPYDRAEGFLVDSSAIMDVQLLPLARSGLFHDDLLIPRFVLDELQGLADGGDDRARRARRGLESLEVLRHEAPTRLYVIDDEVPEVAEVDAKLLALARRLEVRLLTNDLNLARVAELQGVPTVIPRRVAAELIPGVLAGEVIEVELTRSGRHPGQGVGYLEDGSMVVVNGGADLVGAGPVSLAVSSIVPTSAGRIVFARPVAEGRGPNRRPPEQRGAVPDRA